MEKNNGILPSLFSKRELQNHGDNGMTVVLCESVWIKNDRICNKEINYEYLISMMELDYTEGNGMKI